MLFGTPADPFPCFQMIRALETVTLRVEKQMSNAAKLAAFFNNDKHIDELAGLTDGLDKQASRILLEAIGSFEVGNTLLRQLLEYLDSQH